MHELEARRLAGLQDLRDGAYCGKRVALGDVIHHANVYSVIGVVDGGGQPLVAAEVCSGLHHLVDLLVELDDIGGMASGLNAVAAVKRVLGEGHLEEGALHHVAQVGQPRLRVLYLAAVHLVVVDGDAHDVSAGASRDRAHGSADATARIQNLHARLKLDLFANLQLVADDGLVEGLALAARGEVEGLAPSVLVEVGDQIVKGVHELRGVELALADALAFRLGEEFFIAVDVILHLILGQIAGVESLENAGAETGVPAPKLVAHVQSGHARRAVHDDGAGLALHHAAQVELEAHIDQFNVLWTFCKHLQAVLSVKLSNGSAALGGASR
mmetsp:Transcript_24847/g.41538  ORF Transcript_24847/g.41538 Transcript_24847/m.41538 type:complete len:328 (-) Transcript_24847:9-992(-)